MHIADARNHWMANAVGDGLGMPDVATGAETKAGLKRVLRESWNRLADFLTDPAKLDADYMPPLTDPQVRQTGHMIAFHRLWHELHHRADITHHLTQLGFDPPSGLDEVTLG